jgi:hypothetical protein
VDDDAEDSKKKQKRRNDKVRSSFALLIKQPADALSCPESVCALQSDKNRSNPGRLHATIIETVHAQ